MALRLPRLRINKLWLLLIVAALLGLLATWLAISYLKTREQRIAAELAQKAKGGPTVTVVVPTRNVPKGTPLDQTVVAAREIAADLVYGDTITADQFDQVAGKRLLRDVEQGRPLLRADVFDDRAKDFSDLVEPGKRAVTIEIDELNSFAGMLKPGNLVDLLLIATEQQVPGAPASMGGQEVLDLMQKVKVLATGQAIQGDDKEVPAQLQDGGAPRRTAYSNITVEVTLEQAAKITLGMQSGKVRMALRNTNDARETVLGLINTGSLYDGVPPQARVRVAQRQTRAQMQSRIAPDGGDYVEYIVGGRSSGTGAAAPINITLPQLPPGASIPGVTPEAATAGQQSGMASQAQNPAFSSLPPSITSGIPSVPTGAAPR